MAPGMTVRVRDSYCNGEGSMRGNMLSLIPLVDEHGRPELDQGALHRYLAEAVWLPTALLPDQGVRWTPIDDTSALAGLRHHGVEVSLEFRFNQVGEITRVFTPERYREVEGAYQPTPWEGTFGRYEVREGLLIPIEGEVAWILPEGRFSYWRGEVVEVDYEPDVKSCNQKR